MAIQGPLLVKVSTATTGTGTYTYTEAVANGYRTVTDALNDGDVSNGDQIYYVVIDTTVDGSNAKMFEAGLGTLNTTAKTLTRDQVLQSSNSGSAIDWGAGTRDLYVVTVYEVLALLAGANVFTNALNTFEGDVHLTRGAVTNTLTRTLVIGGARNSGGSNFAQLDLKNYDADSAATLYTGARISSRNDGNANDGSLRFSVADNQSLQLALRISSTRTVVVESDDLQDSGGRKYVRFAGGGVTGMVFKQSSAPTGWTKSTADNDACLRVVSGTPGASGGSRAISSATVGSTTLSLSQIPSHNHGVQAGTASQTPSGIDNTILVNPFGSGSSLFNVANAGGGSGHDHALALKYVDCIVCTLN